MSSSNHNENSNAKRNISTVATGKDILALTKELGDLIDNGSTSPSKVKDSNNRPAVKEMNYFTSTRELPLTKEEVKGVDKPKNVGPIYNYNTVENFKELFSYRKPILLAELEKAHRSLTEPYCEVNSDKLINEANSDVNNNEVINQANSHVNNEVINDVINEVNSYGNDEVNNDSRNFPEDFTDLEQSIVESNVNHNEEPRTLEVIPEIQLDQNGREEVQLRSIHESSLELEVSNSSCNLKNEIDNGAINDVVEVANEAGDETGYEAITKVKAEPAYNSTQAILAQQRIRELKEKSLAAEGVKASGLQLQPQQVNNLNHRIETAKPETAGPKKTYLLPAWSLLKEPPRVQQEGDSEDALANALLLEETLANFGVKAQVTNFSEGPTITRFEIQPAPGVKVSRIVNLADDIALCLAAGNVRIEAPIPGKSAVGIEVPNSRNQAVYLKDVITDGSFVHGPSKLLVALGKDISGKPTMADLTKMPHLLIAGSTGSGKSVCMNSIITSILYRANPDEVKFLMVDPKMVELSVYNGIPHLIAPVIVDPKKATAALKWVVNEMENRYNLFAANGVRNLEGYNKGLVSLGEKPLPLILVLIDELADLMMVASRDVEESICRLAQKARAAGIHLVIATQRPSVDVITGIIKANIPSRISFAVSSQIDSRTILDLSGAEKLLGRGDMLYSPIGTPKPVRVQGVYVSDEEVERVVGYWKQQGKPEYEEGVLLEVEAAVNNNPTLGEDDDELLPEATKLVVQAGQASVSLLQRRFRIGYTRAARLIDLMEERGIVGGYEGSKPRSVLISLEDWEIENGVVEN